MTPILRYVIIFNNIWEEGICLEFSFNFYREIIVKLSTSLKPSFFQEYSEKGKLFLRHDVDIFAENTINMAAIENNCGVSSTFFFQPDNDFYNILSSKTLKIIDKLSQMGHQIGLHVNSPIEESRGDLSEAIPRLYGFYSRYIPLTNVISFHHPPQKVMNNFEINGFLNVYGEKYFKNIRFFSDSKRREFADQLISSFENDKEKSIQLLTHPFWWDHFSMDLWEAWERFNEVKKEGFKESLKDGFEPYRIFFDSRFGG